MKHATLDKIAPVSLEAHTARIPNPQPAGISKTGLRIFFFLAQRAPWVLQLLRPAGIWLAIRCSRKIRESTAANARRIFGPQTTHAEERQFAHGVVGHFYDFVVDVAKSGRMTPKQLRERIETIEGREAYLEHRKQGHGAIILTAHMGSFEVGLAALADVEQNIHVVFKRDAMDGFESVRTALRTNLGVHEAAIDDGWDTWMNLRDALEQNHVVVMQADRAMPGQKAQALPMLNGHLMLPLGPLKLAQISGSPLVPVFTVRTPGGGCKLFAEKPVYVDPHAELIHGIHPALLEVGKVIEKYIAAYPEQWLVLDRAFVEDAVQDKSVV